MEIIREKKLIHHIPCLIIRPNTSEKLNTIILYHGWHSSKEYMEFIAKLLSFFNYQIICPDAIYHGDRNPIDYDKEGQLDYYFWRIIKQTIEESDMLIETILKFENVKDLMVMGTSMGGFSASGIFVRHQVLKGLININGGCAFLYCENLFRELEQKPPLNEEDSFSLKTIDPISYLEKLNNRPLYMLHGINDEVIPIQIERYFLKEALSYYQNPEHIHLFEYHGINHKMDIGMIEEITTQLTRIFK